MGEVAVTGREGASSRAQYRRFLPLTLRLGDNDMMGHVNNAHYYALFDTVVCHALFGAGIMGRGGAHRVVMAESGCRYHREIAFPQPIEGAMRVVRLGRSSIRYAVAVFAQGAELASADGFMVHVCVSSRSRRPEPMPAEWRAPLEALMDGG